jgi:hypothetical protein
MNFWLEKEHGIAKLDRMGKNSFTYAKNKFQTGLIFPGRDISIKRRLDRITSIGFTCDGASHLSSMADILLGSFRYCVNDAEKDKAGRVMLPKLVPLMWTAIRDAFNLVSAIAAVLWLSTIGLLRVIKPELDPRTRMISEYACGAWGWIMQLAFFCMAVSCWALAAAIWTLQSALGPTLLVVCASASWVRAFSSPTLFCRWSERKR